MDNTDVVHTCMYLQDMGCRRWHVPAQTCCKLLVYISPSTGPLGSVESLSKPSPRLSSRGRRPRSRPVGSCPGLGGALASVVGLLDPLGPCMGKEPFTKMLDHGVESIVKDVILNSYVVKAPLLCTPYLFQIVSSFIIADILPAAHIPARLQTLQNLQKLPKRPGTISIIASRLAR